MSAAAGIAKNFGYEVSGSDARELYSPSKEVLAEQGIGYAQGYNASNIEAAGADLYIASAGEDTQNPEIAWLVEQGKEVHSFSELLAELYKDKIRIVVTGTHGKSTTAGWLGYALEQLDNSSFMTGAALQGTNKNFHAGSGHYAVFEGDEYKATFEDSTPKFHLYKPDLVVLNNVEFDHPDIFSNLEEVKAEFLELLENLPDDGLVIFNADDVNLADIVYKQNHRAFGFSIDQTSDIQLNGFAAAQGITTLRLINRLNPDNVRTEEYTIALPGEINIRNALAVIAALRALGFQPEAVAKHLAAYHGVKRRFEVLAEDPITIIDDFAHHPTAVKETLAAAKEKYPGKKLWAVFEPHTYSRTKATLEGLAQAFNEADQVLLAPMYGAREHRDSVGITDEEVLAAVQKFQPNARLVADQVGALAILKTETKPGDVVVVMSAGTFNKVAYELQEVKSKK